MVSAVFSVLKSCALGERVHLIRKKNGHEGVYCSSRNKKTKKGLLPMERRTKYQHKEATARCAWLERGEKKKKKAKTFSNGAPSLGEGVCTR